MASIVFLLPYAHIVLSVILVALILVQRSEAALGGAFGGDSFSTTHHTKRGIEKTLFNWTIIVAVLFVLSVFLSLVL